MDMIRVGTSHYVSRGHVLRSYFGDTDSKLTDGSISIGEPAYDKAKGERLVHDAKGRYHILYPAG